MDIPLLIHKSECFVYLWYAVSQQHYDIIRLFFFEIKKEIYPHILAKP